MLVICNGAFKSGSSWLHALAKSVLQKNFVAITPVPKDYNTGKSPVSLISEQQLPRFIKNEDIQHNNYLTKAHFFSESTLARSYPDEVIFIFIERDLRDAIVSHYHHFKVKINKPVNFSCYYWLIGRYKAYEISLFNNRCHKYFGDKNFFSYEKMKLDPAAAIQRLCVVIGLPPLSNKELDSVIDETSIESMREKAATGSLVYYHDAGVKHAEMFRKGAIGEYRKYIGARALSDLNEIANLKFSAVDRFIYKLMFTYRRALR